MGVGFGIFNFFYFSPPMILVDRNSCQLFSFRTLSVIVLFEASACLS